MNGYVDYKQASEYSKALTEIMNQLDKFGDVEMLYNNAANDVNVEMGNYRSVQLGDEVKIENNLAIEKRFIQYVVREHESELRDRVGNDDALKKFGSLDAYQNNPELEFAYKTNSLLFVEATTEAIKNQRDLAQIKSESRVTEPANMQRILQHTSDNLTAVLKPEGIPQFAETVNTIKEKVSAIMTEAASRIKAEKDINHNGFLSSSEKETISALSERIAVTSAALRAIGDTEGEVLAKKLEERPNLFSEQLGKMPQTANIRANVQVVADVYYIEILNDTKAKMGKHPDADLIYDKAYDERMQHSNQYFITSDITEPERTVASLVDVFYPHTAEQASKTKLFGETYDGVLYNQGVQAKFVDAVKDGVAVAALRRNIDEARGNGAFDNLSYVSATELINTFKDKMISDAYTTKEVAEATTNIASKSHGKTIDEV